ncbi:hypothetical protein G7Y89_g10650 [Cudoniella acicularis]|uniref:Uncharacterized protein n=1 Tax=Cudoniella acicularis TaxID=354080 RepID=A0A8H4VYT8_9HELO|nr:hypothetical protein G7Y89_g10650 [Cudoniella acicularis]
MATNLGKRKRHSKEATKNEPGSDSDGSSVPEIDAQEIFRRHFETQFKPLPVVIKVSAVEEDVVDEESGDDSEWDGISEAAEDSVEVVEHSDAQSRMAAMSKEELKAFMGSKPPKSLSTVSLIRDKAGATIEDDDVSEAANLKKDLALQRLLSESHLLESASNPTIVGKNRHKATDLRMQTLGSKTSIFKQEKMPISHRKGIIAKQSDKEEKRRREARENGIILEKAKMKSRASDGKRDRGVGAPAVGKFSGGTLKLSKKDIFDIEGPKRSASDRDVDAPFPFNVKDLLVIADSEIPTDARDMSHYLGKLTPHKNIIKIRVDDIFETPIYNNKRLIYEGDVSKYFLCLGGTGHECGEDVKPMGWEELKEAYKAEDPTIKQLEHM